MKTKIFVVSPYLKDANSLWRCIGPLAYLSKNSADIEITCPSEDDCAWNSMADCHILFLHRPCRPQDMIALQIAKNLNIPVWVDFDDWLFDLPSWNPAKSIYNNPGVQSIIAHTIACADVVSCTTGALYERFKQVNPNVVIVPNAYRSDLFPYRNEVLPPRNNLFAWRGTNTHDGDLLSVQGAWKDLKAPIHFFGFPHWMVLNEIKNIPDCKITEAQDPFLFFRHLYSIAPKVMLFPLQNCFFNHCKSNIAYIEAIHAGALVVAPDLPEWKRPGVITYAPDDPHAFLDAANRAVEIPQDHHDGLLREAFSEMKRLYGIETVNKIRLQIVNALVSGNYQRNERDPFDQLTALWAVSKLKNLPMKTVTPDYLKSKNLE